MGGLHDLTTGLVSPTVAAIFATLGCLLGILLVTRARQRTGWRRVRLVAYATVGLALPALFLPGLVAVMALRVDGSVLRLVPAPLGYSLAAAAGGTALALLLVCSGRPGSLRQVLAGGVFVATIGAGSIFLAASLTTGVPIGAEIAPTGIALALACVTGVGLAAALAATRTLRMAFGSAVLLGLSLAALYHVAAAGLRLEPNSGAAIPADEVAGLSPQRIGLPAVIVTAVIVALAWYFTLGAASARDLRLMFRPGAEVEQMEPWIIEHVRNRAALTSAAYAPVPGWPEVWAVQHEPTVAVHAIPIVGRNIATAFARALPSRLGDTANDSAHVDLTPLRPVEPDDAVAALWAAWQAVSPASDLADPDSADDGPEPAAADWPAPGRNETGVTRRGGTARANSRFGPHVGASSAPEHRLASLASTEAIAWAARGVSAARATAEGNDGAVAIKYDYRAGSPLPRRNARPVHRP